MADKKKTARPRGADRIKEKAINAWLSFLEFLEFLIDEGPGFLASIIVSILAALVTLWLTGRL